jgi:hypothetical protein
LLLGKGRPACAGRLLCQDDVILLTGLEIHLPAHAETLPQHHVSVHTYHEAVQAGRALATQAAQITGIQRDIDACLSGRRACAAESDSKIDSTLGVRELQA